MNNNLFKPFRPCVAAFYGVTAALLAVLFVLPWAANNQIFFYCYEAIIGLAFLATVVLSFYTRPLSGSKQVMQWYLLPMSTVFIYLCAFPFYRDLPAMLSSIGSILVELICLIIFVRTILSQSKESQVAVSENPWTYLILYVLPIMAAMGKLA